MAPLQGYSKTHPFLSGIASRAVMQLPSNKITLQCTNMSCIAHSKLTMLYNYLCLSQQFSKKTILRFVLVPCYHCHYETISLVSLETAEHGITDTHTHACTHTCTRTLYMYVCSFGGRKCHKLHENWRSRKNLFADWNGEIQCTCTRKTMRNMRVRMTHQRVTELHVHGCSEVDQPGLATMSYHACE